MDTAQHVFYIIGSIALGLMAVFLLIAAAVVIRIGAAIARMRRTVRFTTSLLLHFFRRRH